MSVHYLPLLSYVINVDGSGLKFRQFLLELTGTLLTLNFVIATFIDIDHDITLLYTYNIKYFKYFLLYHYVLCSSILIFLP